MVKLIHSRSGGAYRNEESEHPMIQAKIRKQGNSFVVTIPKDEMEKCDLHEGDQIAFQPTRLETRAVLRPELRKVLDETWEQNEAGYRYLADR
jgi:antitoxin component of MazEF toxin-antitoxin module